MLTQDEISHYYNRLNLTETSCKVIDNIRNSPPSRRVTSGAKNFPGRYPSIKMGVTIQFESNRVEYAGVYEMEFDRDVLEYYDQPPKIKINYLTKTKKGNERNQSFFYTPDFFVIRKSSIEWVEWKTEKELIRLESENPNRYFKDDNGVWRCPPGEQYADQFGFEFKVRSSREINWVIQRNLEFLKDYLQADYLVVSQEAKQSILSQVYKEHGITLAALLNYCETGGFTSDDIYSLIVLNELYADLSQSTLSEPNFVKVYNDFEMASAYKLMSLNQSRERVTIPSPVVVAGGSPVLWDSRRWTIINLGVHTITLLSEEHKDATLPVDIFEKYVNEGFIKGVENDQSEIQPEVQSLLMEASPEDFKQANKRYEAISHYLTDGKSPANRTLRRWIFKYRNAEHLYGNGYIGLLPQTAKKGNRNSKLPESTLDLMNVFIREKYETIKQLGRRQVYGLLVNACEEQGYEEPSYKTFCKAVKSRNRYEQTLKREGKRSAYKHEPFYYELDMLKTSRHGERPFHIAHIDHTELDIQLVCSKTGKNLGKPWVTFMVDAFSRRILAYYLTFSSPSYRSCMMVIRECVRRYSRLPGKVVVDGGKEFNSTYFETLLARYKVEKVERTGKPRAGSIIERLFGTTNTQFIHNLLGNTQIMKNVRQVTKSVNPKNHAVWTLEALNQSLNTFLYEVYDNIEHPNLEQTPCEAFERGLAQTGFRPSTLISYNYEFQIFTLPTTKKGTAKVEPGLGVKVNYIYYWSDSFRNPIIEMTQVPVRFDPFDISIAYAYVNKQWVRCVSEYYSIFKGRTERELKMLTEEIKKRKQNHSQSFTITAKKMAHFLSELEQKEEWLTQRLREEENSRVFTVLQGGADVRSNKQHIKGQIEGHNFKTIVEDDKTVDLDKMQFYEEY